MGSRPRPPRCQETLIVMGVEIETLQPGDGATFPKPGQRVSCHYVLTLTDGKKIDSSRDRGQRAKLTISADMGYGAQGVPGCIPPNATLVFDGALGCQVNTVAGSPKFVFLSILQQNSQMLT